MAIEDLQERPPAQTRELFELHEPPADWGHGHPDWDTVEWPRWLRWVGALGFLTR